MTRNNIKIGIIGTGFMAKAHINAYKTMSYIGFEKYQFDPVLEMIAGSSEEKALRAAEKYGVKSATGDWKNLVESPSIDVVDNVSPDRLHCEPCILAAQNGKHICCEKPIATSVVNARRMVKAVKESGVKNIIGFNYRFFPAVRLAYELIKSGRIGDVYHFTGKYYQDHGTDPETCPEDIWYIGWSGVGQGIGTHLIDMSRFLVGEVASVRGMVKTYNTERKNKNSERVSCTSDEGFFALVNFENGATGVYESLGIAAGEKNHFSFEIFGTKGGLKWDLNYPNDLYFAETSSGSGFDGYKKINVTEESHPLTDIWWPKGHVLGWEHGHINLLAHFMNCIENDLSVGPFGATFEDGLCVAEIIEAICRSSENGLIENVIHEC